jgi:hypothetical protein
MLYRLDSLSESWYYLGRDRPEASVTASTATACCLKLSPTQRLFAVGHANGMVAVGSLQPFGVGCAPLFNTKLSTARVLDVFWTGDDTLWVCTGSGLVKVLNFDACGVVSPVATYKLPGSAQCTSICACPERGFVIFGTARGAVVLFRLEWTDHPQLLCVARHVHRKERVRAMQLVGDTVHVAGHTGQIVQLKVCIGSCTCGGSCATSEHTVTSFDYDLGDSGGWYTPRYRPQVQLLPPFAQGVWFALLVVAFSSSVVEWLCCFFASEITCRCQVLGVIRTGTLRLKAMVGVQHFRADEGSGLPGVVIGWHAKHLVVADVSSLGHRELLKLDCGNWHRVHDVLLDNGRVLFFRRIVPHVSS